MLLHLPVCGKVRTSFLASDESGFVVTASTK